MHYVYCLSNHDSVASWKQGKRRTVVGIVQSVGAFVHTYRESGSVLVPFMRPGGFGPGPASTRTSIATHLALEVVLKVVAVDRNDSSVTDTGQNEIRQAKSTLSMADNYLLAGKPQHAIKRYEKIIEAYPDTVYAEQAKAGIERARASMTSTRDSKPQS